MTFVESGALVGAAASGDESAWELLVDRFADLVWSVARAHGLDQADSADVSQTTWLHLAEHIGRIREPEKIGSWLITTARRESLRTIRGARRQVLVEDSPDWRCEDPTVDVDDQLDSSRRERHLKAAFDSLADPCRQLLRILMADPPPRYADVSDALGMPVGSIGPTRARCLQRLRLLMTSEEQTGTTGDRAPRRDGAAMKHGTGEPAGTNGAEVAWQRIEVVATRSSRSGG